MADSENSFFNKVFTFFEVIVLIIKFWVKTFQCILAKYNTEEKSVQGDIVLITGAGHGMGKELALQYSEFGAIIVAWDINEQLNLETVNLIKSKGKKAYGYTIDVTDREMVLEFGKRVLSEVGAVKILVNNAGIMPQHPFLKHTEKEIRSIFEINVLSHMWIFQAFLPTMIENNCGHIVAMCSMAGLLGSRNIVPYCGSKFAVRGIQEALSEELRAETNGRSKIKFTTVYPYAVQTGLFKKFKVRFESLMPIIDPKDAAKAIISAQRRGVQEISIPNDMIYSTTFFRMFPTEANLLVRDYLSAYVESDQ